jgi:hypothetical protein
LDIEESLKAWKKYLAIKIPAANRINIPKKGKAGHILGPIWEYLQPEEGCNGQKGRMK